MELNGRTVHFKRTIWSTNAVMKMCPDGDLGRFQELFNGDASDQMMTMASFIVALSQGYEYFQEFCAKRDGREYNGDPITFDELMALEDFEVFNKLQEEAVAAWVGDAQTTVESEPIKTKKKRKRNHKKSNITYPGMSSSGESST